MSDGYVSRREQRRQNNAQPHVNIEEMGKLQSLYGIKPGTPKIQTIETLLLSEITIEDIAEVMELEADEVKEISDRLSVSWQKAGTAPSKEERELERGKMLTRLRRYLQEINQQELMQPDAKNFAQKVQIEDRIRELQKLNHGKDEQADLEMTEEDELNLLLNAMPAEKLAAMMAELSDEPQKASVPVVPE